MKFLIVEPSPLPILIPLGPKYSPQDPVFKYDNWKQAYYLCLVKLQFKVRIFLLISEIEIDILI